MAESKSSDDEQAYLRTSIDLLHAEHRAETERVDRVRQGAHATFLLAPLVVGYSVESTYWGSSDPLAYAWKTILIVAALAAFVLWCLILRVQKAHPILPAEIFDVEDMPEARGDFPQRLRRIRNYLRDEALPTARAVGDKLVAHRDHALWTTALLVAWALTPKIFEAFK